MGAPRKLRLAGPWLHRSGEGPPERRKMKKTGVEIQKTEPTNQLAGPEPGEGPKRIVPPTDHGQLTKINLS
jgi:hypothetical protein